MISQRSGDNATTAWAVPKIAPAAFLATALLTVTGACAQTRGNLEEVVVTAQKRVQSLQDTPIAITAFGSGELAQKRIRDITDLGTFAPNVKITPLPSNTSKATIAIRGSVTSNPAITWEPTVGIYLDGVFMGKYSGNVFRVADLERIEILRGPQGTLYGKNTMGGAVNMITALPTGEWGGKLHTGIGNYDYREIGGSLNLPSLELGTAGALRAKVSLSKEERDGFYDNVAAAQGSIVNPLTGQPIEPGDPGASAHNALDNEVGRLDLLWEVMDELQLRYTVDKVDTDNTPAKPQLTDLDTDNLAFGFPFPEDLGKYVLADDRNIEQNTTDFDTYERFESTSHSLFGSYGIGSAGALGELTLKYIGNFRELDFEQSLDVDGTPFALFHVASQRETYEQTSHEVQITGSTDRTEYVLGLYYFEEKADVHDPLQPINAFIGPMTIHNRYGFEAAQKAAYGQVEWRPTPRVFADRLALIAGLRWTREEKDAYIHHPDDTDAAGNPAPFSARAGRSWTNVTPTLVAAYDLSPAVNVYAKYSEGFKAGGFNGEAESAAEFRAGYDPEEVAAYEVGLKSRWMDNSLQINAAMFYNKEKDLQLSVFSSGATAASVVRNAGRAVKRGGELEIVYQPTTSLRLMANLGYLEAEYKEFEEFDPIAGTVIDKSDEKDNQYAPRHTYNVGAEYTIASGEWGQAIARIDYSYNDDYVAYIEPEQNRSLMFDGYGILNGRLSLAGIPLTDHATVQIALWGKNLTDEDYRLNGIPLGPIAVSYFGDPRTYGVEAAVEF